MAYFGAVKIIDIYGNLIELIDVSDTLKEILEQLKIMNVQLASITDEEIKKEDDTNES